MNFNLKQNALEVGSCRSEWKYANVVAVVAAYKHGDNNDNADDDDDDADNDGDIDGDGGCG